MDENSEDKIKLLRPDYLNLMLYYQKIEDYLFQIAQGYLSFRKNIDKDYIKKLPFSSLKELITPFRWYLQYKGYKEDSIKDRLYMASKRRNYYVHEFFARVYLDLFDENEKMIDEAYEKLDGEIMDDLLEAEDLYATLLSSYGPHPKEKGRYMDISSSSASLTSFGASKEQLSDEYEEKRIEALPDLYWNLLRGYTLLEASLFSSISMIEETYPFLGETFGDSFHSLSFGQYQKALQLGTKKNPMVAMIVDDCLPNLKNYLNNLSSLQFDRNHWIHFCLGKRVFNEKLSSFYSSPKVFDNACKTYAFLQKCFEDTLSFEEKIKRRLRK